MTLRPSLLVLLVALATGCKPAADTTAAEPTAPLQLVKEDIVDVTQGVLADGPVISGSLQAKKQADLRSEIAAVVVQVLKDNGDLVQQGDLLLKLDDTAFLEAQRSALEAERTAQLSVQQAQRQVQRLEALFKTGAISSQVKEDAQLKLDAAQSELAAAKARSAQAQQQLARTRVLAPFNGIVAQRQVSSGDTAQVGKALLQVLDPNSLAFVGQVSASHMSRVHGGQKVRFFTNGDRSQAFAGEVLRVNPVADTATRQIAVEVKLADPKGLSAGLFAEGHIETGALPGITVPNSAQVQQGDHLFVWQLVGDSLKKTEITSTGRDPYTGDLLVQAGLKAGDKVLRQPRGLLKDGAKFILAPTPMNAQAL
ncbi:MAG TPA: efflux RND transporter periplasmic adaptor subunit [Cellvibrionaceae bacterium]|nr:efflux RND transporter periplasmic adaptor subunit [Cellvibrionaceae bacterium]